ncbi:hypothetical protein HanXRQr2_Chr11g0519541 [Helianthus annuus]|uniref:Uncharacterized protein n=1 Tax=Helianthus annuus TaxID=4232 RepID=A0A9K3HTK6_HELAN|nr:hypothetical protein HanXRQr2_Chr11g0519541 [Helianthus annuus]KAJ0877480.1 hypothetical protein HanPSC8_Chr11g0500621 [Helianthus annuus]
MMTLMVMTVGRRRLRHGRPVGWSTEVNRRSLGVRVRWFSCVSGDYFGFAQFSFGSDLGSFPVRHRSVTVQSVQVRFNKKTGR